RHEGVDYEAVAGQAVVAPISGFVSHIGYAYGDSSRHRYVEITNPALGYEARVFYIDPDVKVGDAVRVGAPIGTVLSLQDRYAGITDHVHLEIAAPRQGRIDATRMIAQRTVRADLRG
ncbi:M23 family metallopeptidase, partial [Phenylobacterium sp.]|uniref:M23 family metallopeptidase n=1 Tax=Phenylobacterium sp. TaxID=1871053 RepID=UPI002E322FD3